MTLRTHIISLPGQATNRGFWVYVLRVESAVGQMLYVGCTGTSNGTGAQSPFTRLIEHTKKKSKSSRVMEHLDGVGVDLGACGEVSMIAVGPILPEMPTIDENKMCRQKIVAMERRLWVDLDALGYQTINEPKEEGILDESLWQRVRAEFAIHFPKLDNHAES